MKLNYLFFSVLALLTLPTLSYAQNTSATVTTTFSNMAGANGEDSSVVYSDRSGSPILKNSGFIAIGTFDLDRSAIETLSSATDLSIAFNQFGDASNFNATENGAFQASASGYPSVADEQEYVFDGKAVYVVVGDGTSLEASSEFLVWKSDRVFDGGGPTGGPSEVILSVDGGDLIIGRSGEDTFDFTDVGGEAGRAAFTAVMIDSTLDDHGDSNDTATFIAANSSTSGNIKDGDDVDYFRVDLSEDGNLSLSVAGGSNIVLSVYGEQGDELLSSSSPGQSIVSDLASGTYFISVRGDENSDDIDYGLASEFKEKIINLDPKSAGSYYGLVQYKNSKLVGHALITISSDGMYSGRVIGKFGVVVRLKGLLKPNYSSSTWEGRIFGNRSNMSFNVSENEWGFYTIAGEFNTLGVDSPSHFFDLRPTRYNSSKQVPSSRRGRYTMLASLSDNNEISLGDGFSAGIMKSGGWFRFNGRSNTGRKFTHSAPLLIGQKISFFARPDPSIGLETIMGDLRFRNKTGSDFSGGLRYLRKKSSTGHYKSKFDVNLLMSGAKYTPPGEFQLPVSNYSQDYPNGNASILGGVFNSLSYKVTWEPVIGGMKSVITLFEDQNYEAYCSVDHRYGTFFGKMETPLSSGESTINTYLRGVVLQKSGVVSGQAETVDNGVGRFSIVPAE
jgi:hypothetical protein